MELENRSLPGRIWDQLKGRYGHGENVELLHLLNSLSKFPEFTRRDALWLKSIAYERVFAAKERIFEEGTPNPALYLVRSGIVQLSFQDASGHMRPFFQVKAGGVFGESALMGIRHRWLSASAVNLTEVISLFGSDLDRVFRAHPALGLKVYRAFSESVGNHWQQFMRANISLGSSTDMEEDHGQS